MGAGAYVCGEETALIESLEGFRGEPRNRPPFPVVAGFLNSPTVVNNVETLAWVACIFAKGADWFKSFGTDKSTGHKLFSISRRLREARASTSSPWASPSPSCSRKSAATDAKAVQIGGASRRLRARARTSTARLAFEDIPTGGSVIVIGPRPRHARRGRELPRVLRRGDRAASARRAAWATPSCSRASRCSRRATCSPEYLAELKALGDTMQVASKCGLGQTSPSAFLSILEHFGDEISRPRPERLTRAEE